MRIMLRATYKRQERYDPSRAPELIEAAYGDVPDELVMGQAALGVRDVFVHRGSLEASEELTQAIERARMDGVLMTL